MTRIRSFPLHFAGAIFLLAATLSASRLSARREPGFLAQPLDSIPTEIAGFRGSDNPAPTERVMERLRPSGYLSRTYRKGSESLDLLIVYYAQQRAGESMHSPKHCLPGSGWEIWRHGSQVLPLRDGPATINQYSISRDSQRMQVLYWYQSKQRIVASEYTGKLLLARDALLQNSTAASIVRIVVPDSPASLQGASEFARQLIPHLQRCFGE